MSFPTTNPVQPVTPRTWPIHSGSWPVLHYENTDAEYSLQDVVASVDNNRHLFRNPARAIRVAHYDWLWQEATDWNIARDKEPSQLPHLSAVRMENGVIHAHFDGWFDFRTFIATRRLVAELTEGGREELFSSLATGVTPKFVCSTLSANVLVKLADREDEWLFARRSNEVGTYAEHLSAYVSEGPERNVDANLYAAAARGMDEEGGIKRKKTLQPVGAFITVGPQGCDTGFCAYNDGELTRDQIFEGHANAEDKEEVGRFVVVRSGDRLPRPAVPWLSAMFDAAHAHLALQRLPPLPPGGPGNGLVRPPVSTPYG